MAQQQSIAVAVIALVSASIGYAFHFVDTVINHQEKNDAALVAQVNGFYAALRDAKPTLVAPTSSGREVKLTLAGLFSFTQGCRDVDTRLGEKTTLINLVNQIESPDVQDEIRQTYRLDKDIQAILNVHPELTIALYTKNKKETEPGKSTPNSDPIAVSAIIPNVAVPAPLQNNGWIYIGHGTHLRDRPEVKTLNADQRIEGDVVPGDHETATLRDQANVREGPPSNRRLAPIIGVLTKGTQVRVIGAPSFAKYNDLANVVWLRVQFEATK